VNLGTIAGVATDTVLQAVRDRFSSAVALSDSVANPTTTQVGSNLMLWDASGTQWVRRRQGVVGSITNLTGIPNGIPLGRYNASGITLADGDHRALQLNSTGRLLVDNSGQTQPISGTIGVSSLPSLPAGSNAIGSITNTTFASTQSGTWNVGTLGTITNTVPVGIPRAGSGTVSNASQQTNATGATYNTLASVACYAIEFINNTGTTIEYRRGGSGVAIPIFDKSSKLVIGIANANEISVRRADAGSPTNTQVTIVYEVYS
jgi:hypothetical protein